MPSRSAKPCGKPGCKALVRGAARCPEHTREREQARGSASARGYDASWRALRAAYLSAHPMCSHPDCDLIATDVDHVTPHRGDDKLRLDPDNLQSLCHGHHSSKTVSQDGGLGRVRVYGTARVQGAIIETYPADEWDPSV
jgi:5-methylcytosine-specific restriction protein A